ncbi:MAG: hypothetical protein Q4B69_07180 [Slackia sp.]|nr:hypothetical protein [Slackia sp.]
MERIRTALRILCIAGTICALFCCGAASYLLSNIPLVQDTSLTAAGIAFNADSAYALVGTILFAAALYLFATCLFGIRCARLVRRMNMLRALSLGGFALFVVCILACLVIGEIHRMGWMTVIGAILSYSIASFAGEISRALIASHMLRGNDDA